MPYYSYYYYDSLSLLIMLPALLFAMWAQFRVQSTYKKYSGHRTNRGYTGQQIARMILDENGLRDMRIEQVAGNLSDHYDPRAQVVRLSGGVFGSASIAAAGIAAHECGHAVQHSEGNAPMKLRSAIIPVTNFGSKLAIPLLLIGLLIQSQPLILIGIAAYALMAVFQLFTLPVEFNASRRAMSTIAGSYILDEQEQKGAKKVLTAAALTYVAALATAIAQVLRLLVLFGGRGRRR